MSLLCLSKFIYQIVPGVVSRKPFWTLLLVSSLVYCILTFLKYDDEFWNPSHPNYFLDGEKISSAGFIVDTESCKIPNLNALDMSILPYLSSPSKPTNCRSNRRWTYVVGTNVVVNLTAIRSEGYSFNNIHCCYRAISRVEQTLEKYDDQADAVILVSKDCVPLDKEVNYVPSEFIRVNCISKLWPFYQDVVYRDHHALVQKHYRKSTAKKRTMPSTRKFLKHIGAVEMLGYTKVGENTFPNAVAFLSGLNESSLEKACYFTPLTAQDSCPYIWKDFNEAQYITAHLEDSPELNAFNRFKTGFVQQQVDFYMRPFMQNIFGPLHSKYCAGPDTIEQKIFSFINNIENLSETNGTPYFVFTWLTGLAHSDMYGTFRETFFGWFEDKLPNFWVYLPPKLQSEFPLWAKELKLNSRNLLSPFDLYQTFRHVLQYFSSAYPLTEHARMLALLHIFAHALLPNKFQWTHRNFYQQSSPILRYLAPGYDFRFGHN
ncbi:unnamed protein product [Allacma fusca]|uniref:Uncharacterized protein n=1 Tax=Allacma fusca TaxID=39272 RepID=A0A8J2KA64_9HEXA|nr:unnamed protein product [Allacma fusca]